MLINQVPNLIKATQKKAIKELQIIEGTEENFVNFMWYHQLALYYFNPGYSKPVGGIFIYNQSDDNIYYYGYKTKYAKDISLFSFNTTEPYDWKELQFKEQSFYLEGIGSVEFTRESVIEVLKSNAVSTLIESLFPANSQSHQDAVQSFMRPITCRSSDYFLKDLNLVLSNASEDDLSELKSCITTYISELLLGEGLDQELPQHHCYTVLDHILVSALNAYKFKSPTEVVIAVLLHDIGKPLVKSKMFSERTVYFSHDVVGKLVAEKILTRLGFETKFIQYITDLIGFHERRDLGIKGWKKILQSKGEDFCKDLILVFKSDVYAQAETYREEKLNGINETEVALRHVITGN